MPPPEDDPAALRRSSRLASSLGGLPSSFPAQNLHISTSRTPSFSHTTTPTAVHQRAPAFPPQVTAAFAAFGPACDALYSYTSHLAAVNEANEPRSAEVTALRATNVRLAGEMERWKAERERVIETADQTLQALRQRAQVLRLEGVRGVLEGEKEGVVARVVVLEGEVRAREGELEERDVEVRDLGERVGELVADLAMERGGNGVLLAEVDEVVVERDRALAELEGVRDDLATERALGLQRVEAKDQAVSERDEAIADLKGVRETNLVCQKALQSQLDGCKVDVEHLERRKDSLVRQVNYRDKSIESLQSEITAVKTQLDEKVAQNTRLIKDSNEVKVGVDELLEERDRACEERDAGKLETSRLSDEIASLKQKGEESERLLTTYNEELAREKERVEASRLERDVLERKLDASSKDVGSLTRLLEKKEHEMRTLQSRLDRGTSLAEEMASAYRGICSAPTEAANGENVVESGLLSPTSPTAGHLPHSIKNSPTRTTVDCCPISIKAPDVSLVKDAVVDSPRSSFSPEPPPLPPPSPAFHLNIAPASSSPPPPPPPPPDPRIRFALHKDRAGVNISEKSARFNKLPKLQKALGIETTSTLSPKPPTPQKRKRSLLNEEVSRSKRKGRYTQRPAWARLNHPVRQQMGLW